MALEPGTDVGSGEVGSEIIRPEQVPTGTMGRNGHGIKLAQGANPGVDAGNGSGAGDIHLIRSVVAHERREKALRRLMARRGELSYGELRHRGSIADEEAMLRAEYYTLGDGWLDVAGICAASNGEVMAMVEELGLSVRDRADYLDSLPDHFGVEVVDDGGTDVEIGGDSSPIGLHDDMMCHPDSSDAISDLNAGDEEYLREAEEEEGDGEVDADDEDAISARHDTDPSLQDELRLWTGLEDQEPDDLADTFDRRVERVLARGNKRYLK